MAYFQQYPLGAYAAEQPLWLNFYAAEYSLRNIDRTRPGVVNRSFLHLKLPMPKEPGYQLQHNFGESNNNPVGPILSRAGIANSGGNLFGAGGMNMLARVFQPATFFAERMFATSTYRRFSNIAEFTMVSEARKQYFFQYVFAPKSDAESQSVENIVGSFRKASYPAVADGLPERSYPQNLWSLYVSRGNVAPTVSTSSNEFKPGNLTANWLGEPLVCVLQSVVVKKNDEADSIVRYLPNGNSSVTLLGLLFTEFETGTYFPQFNATWSKSEISSFSFGASR
jgi:hypothetical protein